MYFSEVSYRYIKVFAISVFEEYFIWFVLKVFLKVLQRQITWASVTGRALSATMNCTASLQSGVVKDPS